MRHPHRWEELLPEEFAAEFARAPIVYWACGAMEEHGLQSALGADPYVAYEVCLRAVAISGGIAHPILPLAPAYIPGLSRAELRQREKPLYPPSLFVSRELCKIDRPRPLYPGEVVGDGRAERDHPPDGALAHHGRAGDAGGGQRGGL